MALESLSIRERILRQLQADLGTIAGIGTIHRWDTRGVNALAPMDVVLIPEQETLDEESDGNPGVHRKVLPVVVAMMFTHDERSAVNTDHFANRWRARVWDKIMDNPTIVETAGPRLAVDSVVENIPPVDFEDGANNAALRLTVTYEHDGNSPYVLGTAITLREVVEV